MFNCLNCLYSLYSCKGSFVNRKYSHTTHRVNDLACRSCILRHGLRMDRDMNTKASCEKQ